jgi:hypothetical protein
LWVEGRDGKQGEGEDGARQSDCIDARETKLKGWVNCFGFEMFSVCQPVGCLSEFYRGRLHF